MRAVEPWVRAPLASFLEESAARVVVLMTGSGQVVAQHGFGGSLELMAAAALAAGIMAATAELSRQIGAPQLQQVTYEGRSLGVYLAAFQLPGRKWLGLVGYGKDTSLGLVQFFFGEMVSELSRAAPPLPARTEPSAGFAADFEAELDRSLRALFGR